MLRSPVASTTAPGRCRPRREVSPGRHVCSGRRKSSRRTGRGAERSARSPQGCRLPCGSRSAASPPAPARPRAGRSSERFQRSQHILQQHWIAPSGYPHPGSRELDLDRRCPSDVALFRHHHRDEIERRRPPGFRRSVCRLAQLLAPRIELVAMQPVAARDRTRNRVRSQALGDDLRLLLPAPPPPPLRPRQHLAAARALPINWQLTWQTIHLRLPLRETPSSARRHRLQRVVKASLTKEQTGDPLDLSMNTGFVLVANHRIAFPMPEVATAVHVFGPLPNGHSVGDFHRPAFSAQPAPSFPMAPRELLPQAQLTLRLIIDVLVNGLVVDVLLRWSSPFVDLFPQSSGDLLGRPANSQLANDIGLQRWAGLEHVFLMRVTLSRF